MTEKGLSLEIERELSCCQTFEDNTIVESFWTENRIKASESQHPGTVQKMGPV